MTPKKGEGTVNRKRVYDAEIRLEFGIAASSDAEAQEKLSQVVKHVNTAGMKRVPGFIGPDFHIIQHWESQS